MSSTKPLFCTKKFSSKFVNEFIRHRMAYPNRSAKRVCVPHLVPKLIVKFIPRLMSNQATNSQLPNIFRCGTTKISSRLSTMQRYLRIWLCYDLLAIGLASRLAEIPIIYYRGWNFYAYLSTSRNYERCSLPSNQPYSKNSTFDAWHFPHFAQRLTFLSTNTRRIARLNLRICHSLYAIEPQSSSWKMGPFC